MDPLWVYEGFEIPERWVIVVGVAMDHGRLDQAPPTFENPAAAVEVGDKYNQAARELGFTHAACGPLVRSSYHADKQAHGEKVS